MADYSLSIEEKPGYLHAKVTGINGRESVLGYTQEIFEACLAHDRSAVLIEENLAGPSLSLSAVFQLVDARVAQAMRVLKKIAYVDINPEHDLSRMEFAEDRAVNRGVNMRLFATVERAQDWLEGRAQ
jgi:hypothetical protein